MLNQMRALSKNIIGRSIMAVVLGFIILSFAIWGIGDRFTNFNANELASVGGARIGVDQYRNAYQTQLQQLQQKAKRAITNDEAKRMGLDRQVLYRLVANATLDQQAAKLGLAVSDKTIAQMIVGDPMFRGQNGQFDRDRFNMLLTDNNMNEGRYVKDQREIVLRQDISDAVVGGLAVPTAMEAAIHRYQAEIRDLHFFVLPASAVGTVPAPSNAELQSYYDGRPAAFTAPEYRKLMVLSVVPANLFKPGAVSDADVKKRYDEMKDAMFVVPEKRTEQQLLYPDAAAAVAAKAKLDGGESFDQLAKDEKKSLSDIDLGTVAKGQLGEAAVGDAAFALAEGGTSAPVKTQFGSVLVHVAKILPMRRQSLDEVAPQLRDQLAAVHAKGEATRMRDAIEDQRAAGKTLTEAAASVGLKPRAVEAIDARGYDKTHKPVEGLVDGPALLKAAFTADVGSDTEMLQTADGGDVWYEVAGVEAARKLPLDAVKATVEKLWRDDETARRLAGESDKVVAAIDGGKALADVAAAHGKLTVMRGVNISRNGTPDLPPAVAAAVFDAATGKAGSSASGPNGRIIFQVDAARVPPINPGDENFGKLMAQVKGGLVDDVLTQYLASVQGEIGIKINQQSLRSAISDNSGS